MNGNLKLMLLQAMLAGANSGSGKSEMNSTMCCYWGSLEELVLFHRFDTKHVNMRADMTEYYYSSRLI